MNPSNFKYIGSYESVSKFYQSCSTFSTSIKYLTQSLAKIEAEMRQQAYEKHGDKLQSFELQQVTKIGLWHYLAIWKTIYLPEGRKKENDKY